MRKGIVRGTLVMAVALALGLSSAQAQVAAPQNDDTLLAEVAADGGVRSIAGGYGHSCAVSGGGHVWCWGYNQFGQLGIGNTDNTLAPRRVPLGGTVVSVVTGSVFTCALTAVGRVYCWGYNGHGELGNGTTVNSPTPVRVSTLRNGVRSIAAGVSHACAISVHQALWCWGNNVEGQLGNGTIGESIRPIHVPGIAGRVTAVTAGYWHTCARARQGRVWCWGNNFRGQLGIGTLDNQRSPVRVPAIGRDVIAISAGGHFTCAINRRAALLCWGANDTGQLGNGTTELAWLPQPISGNRRFRSVATGSTSLTGTWGTTCAVTNRGAAYCWGLNGNGQLGIGNSENTAVPSPVSGLGSNVRAMTVAHNGTHSCAINGAGIAFCWGANSFGQLGIGSMTEWTTPRRVHGRLDIR